MHHTQMNKNKRLQIMIMKRVELNQCSEKQAIS
jgi:hypothetical protein